MGFPEKRQDMSDSKPIDILLVEDEPAHAESIRRAFLLSGKRAEIRVVGTLREFRAQVEARVPEIAVLDLNLPDGKAMDVLISPPEAGAFPFLVITSYGDERLAVAALKAGALDYIVKSPEAFAAMPHSVERALREWALLQDRKQRDEEIARVAMEWQATFDATNNAVWILDRDHRILRSNKTAERYFYRSLEEMIGKPCCEIVHGTARPIPECPVIRLQESLHRETSELQVGENWFEIVTDPILNAAGELSGVVHIVSDITERKAAEQALQLAEERMRSIVEAAPFGAHSYELYPDGRLVFSGFNRSADQILGIRHTDLIGKTIEEAFPPLGGTPIPALYRKVAATGERYDDEQVDYRDGQIQGAFDIHAFQTGSNRMTVFFRDITERRRAEEALQKKDDLLTQAERMGKVGGWEFDIETKQQTWTETVYEIHEFDFASRPTVGQGLNFYTPESRPIIERAVQRAIEQGEPFDLELEVITAKGNRRSVHAIGTTDLERRKVSGFIQDITDRKKAEDSLKASLREKEVLLREIHHRVKNNMQVISSLFNLQARAPISAECREILREGQTRIRSMSLVHEKLYQSRDLSKIDLAGYIQSLTVHLFHVYLVNPEQVRLETEFEDVALDINSAIPCGLILNELISNALKHAFPNGRTGVIRIGLRRGTGGAVELRVADDGVGFPAESDFREAESFGLQIVNLLVHQLEAAIDLDRTKGTAFTVTFRELKYAPRI
jgi:PAS domain S-box-containing protein